MTVIKQLFVSRLMFDTDLIQPGDLVIVTGAVVGDKMTPVPSMRAFAGYRGFVVSCTPTELVFDTYYETTEERSSRRSIKIDDAPRYNIVVFAPWRYRGGMTGFVKHLTADASDSLSD